MAGHSHWHNIQQKKGKNDAKRNALFSKAAQQIIVAAREGGGGDPDHNLSLRIAIDAAKAVNMPKDSIERTIKKATGEGSEGSIQKAIYEGYGPLKVPFVISTLTDNTNRTVSELRNIFSKAGGELGNQGSVMWQFTEEGEIVMKSAKMKKSEKFGEDDIEEILPKEDVMLDVLEIEGVEDIIEDEDNILIIKTSITNVGRVSNDISAKGYIVTSSGPNYEPNTKITVPKDKEERFAEFLETVEDNPDVQTVWHGAA